MADELYAFDREGAKRIVDMVREVENQTLNLGTPNDDDDQLFQVQGKMTSALGMGTGFSQSPSTATMQVYIPDESNNNQLVDAGYQITITNRDSGITKAVNDWCRAVFVNGEWQPHGCT